MALAIIAAVTAVASCKTVYVPNTVNAPLLQEKGELRANLNANNLQAAYAVSDGMGVLANGFYESSSGDQAAASGQDGRGYLLELGAGHFRPLGDGAVFEAYGGAGYGHVRHDNWETTNGVRSNYKFATSAVKAFVQPSLGITRTYFDAVVATRFVGLRAFGTDTFNYTQERLREDNLLGIDQRTWLFVEPAVTLRAGYKWVKAFFQYGYSFKLNEAALNRDETFATIGIHVDLAPRF
ncbi:MAG TPA: hypothetical protein VGF45_09915 [Polyangia bacterium]